MYQLAREMKHQAHLHASSLIDALLRGNMTDSERKRDREEQLTVAILTVNSMISICLTYQLYHNTQQTFMLKDYM